MELILVLVVLAVVGTGIGALARLILPGKDPMPLWVMVGIGTVSAVVSGLIGYAILETLGAIVLAVGGAVGLVWFYRRRKRRKGAVQAAAPAPVPPSPALPAAATPPAPAPVAVPVATPAPQDQAQAGTTQAPAATTAAPAPPAATPVGPAPAAAPGATETQAPQDRFCASCGTEFTGNERFCTNCGAPRS